jgi:signal transduction histidine kinase
MMTPKWLFDFSTNELHHSYKDGIECMERRATHNAKPCFTRTSHTGRRVGLLLRRVGLVALPAGLVRLVVSRTALANSSLNFASFLLAAGVWGAVAAAGFSGGKRAHGPEFVMRTIAIFACAASTPLFGNADGKLWAVPVTFSFLLAWLTWTQVANWVPSRLGLLIKTVLVTACFFLGGAISVAYSGPPIKMIAAVTVAWTLLGLAELGLGAVDGRPIHSWNAVAQLTLATAPAMVYFVGPTNRSATAIYCAFVGAGLLVGQIVDAKRQQAWVASTISKLNLRSEHDAARANDQTVQVAARLHDQTAALFSVETLMSLLKRQAEGDIALELTKDEHGKLFDSALEEIARARKLARSDQISLTTCDLAEVLVPPLKLIQLHQPSISIELRAGMVVIADPDALVDAVRNLVYNALEHGQRTPILVQSIATYTGYDLSVSDNGPGIPQLLHEKIFERGYGSSRGGMVSRTPAKRWKRWAVDSNLRQPTREQSL